MFSKRSLSRVGALAATALTIFGIAIACYRWLYPYGHRVGCVPNTVGALLVYTQTHQGWFPGTNDSDGVRALERLYPEFLGSELAGITGDRKEVLHRLRSGQPLDEAVSTWVYHAGLRCDDDPKTALLWERCAGVTLNGRRDSGHAVVFVDGRMEQIPDNLWPSFVEEQAKRRREITTNRLAASSRR